MPEPAPPWGLGAALVTVIVAFVLVVAGTTIALVWLEGRRIAELAGWTLASLIITIYVMQTRRRPEERTALRLDVSGMPLPFVMFFSLGFALLFDLISLAVTSEFLPVPELLAVNLRAGGVVEWVFAVGFMMLAQPIAEELVFRGVAFLALRTMFGGWIGLIASAGLYAVFHLLAYPPNYANVSGITPIWYGLLLPFLDGLIISAIRAYTGSTRAAMAAHAAFGLFAVVKLLVG
jgi:membrane protease YdiL (CAAX protease family)